jgi:hypothetical protein
MPSIARMQRFLLLTKDLILVGGYSCPVAESLTKKGDPSVGRQRLPQDDRQGAAGFL